VHLASRQVGHVFFGDAQGPHKFVPTRELHSHQVALFGNH
jgi:hypothetical protein